MMATKLDAQQIAQEQHDEVNKAQRVNVVATGANGLATEATLSDIKTDTEAIETATESIDAKTPALSSGRVPVEVQSQVITELQDIEAAIATSNTNLSTINGNLVDIKTDTEAIELAVESIDTKTPTLINNAVPIISGLGVPRHDTIEYSSGATTDTYTYKTGGLSGTLVSTVTITYTDNTKATLQSVVRT
jgi:hypothetical protein